MRTRSWSLAAAACLVLAAPLLIAQSESQPDTSQSPAARGRQIFRFDAFGDEQLWTDTLQLHTAIAKVSPATALAVGLKVDVDALPPAVAEAVRTGQGVDLNDPAVTLQLLQLNAVVGFETVTGGPISYWNNYVGVSQMGGHGNFSDPRIGLSIVQPPPDLVTPELPALLAYQLSLDAPEPPRGSFDQAAARRGEGLFNGQAACASCHRPPAFTDVLRPRSDAPNLHAPAETGMEPLYAARTATGAYRTSPLRGIWQHPPYFHDGSAADLAAVVAHYDTVLSLGLTGPQQADLVEFLKSL